MFPNLVSNFTSTPLIQCILSMNTLMFKIGSSLFQHEGATLGIPSQLPPKTKK